MIAVETVDISARSLIGELREGQLADRWRPAAALALYDPDTKQTALVEGRRVGGEGSAFPISDELSRLPANALPLPSMVGEALQPVLQELGVNDATVTSVYGLLKDELDMAPTNGLAAGTVDDGRINLLLPFLVVVTQPAPLQASGLWVRLAAAAETIRLGEGHPLVQRGHMRLAQRALRLAGSLPAS